MRSLLLALFLLSLMPGPAWAYYPWEVWQGDRAYARGELDEAMAHYRQALAERPDDPRVLYNLGVCLSEQEKLDEASQHFQTIENAKDPEFIGRAAYNRGNALFKQQKLEEALDAYKVALRWNELDDDARYNIEVILDLMKQKQQQEQNQENQDDQDQQQDRDEQDKQDKEKQNEGDQEQDQQDQDDQDQQDQDQQNQDDQNKQDQDQQNQDDQNKQDQDQQNQDDQNKQDQDQKNQDDQNQQNPPQNQNQQQQPREMSKEEAERLLQYFENKEAEGTPKRGAVRLQPPRGTETW